MVKQPETGYEIHAFTAHPLYDPNDAFSRHFLEVYRDVGSKTLLCPDCTACASFKSFAHLKAHYTTYKGPTIVGAGPFAEIALDEGEHNPEFIEIYRKLVEVTPEAQTTVSFSAMLAILQERLIREGGARGCRLFLGRCRQPMGACEPNGDIQKQE